MSLYNRSPLRWLGGKFNRLEDIARYIPDGAKRTIEPFAGSAVFSSNLGRGKAIVNDINRDVINLYRHILNHRRALIAELHNLFVSANNTKIAYLSLRDEFNSTDKSLRKAALFVYLNRHGYAGMTTYTTGGVFNTPFGNFKSIPWPEAALALFADQCGGFVFSSDDFTKIIAKAGKGDLIYADPPYLNSSKGASFVSYTKDGFKCNLHQVLVDLTIDARNRGATVIISNHFTPETEALYAKASKIESFDVLRKVACKRNEPMIVKECLAIYQPKKHRK